MPVSIPLILETTQLAIDSCDPMNLDTGDISNTGKSTGAQTNLDSKIAQTNAIEASSETFKTLGDLTQLLIPIKNEFVDIVARINAKLRPYEEKVQRAQDEFAQITDSENWYATNIPLEEAERDAAIVDRDNAQAALDALDSNSPTYATDAAVQNNIIGNATSNIVTAQINLDNYANEVVDLANNRAEWQTFNDYHQAVIDDIISTFNTIMAPVRSAFGAAKTAITTSNGYITSSKSMMLDNAALIAKTLAKTASAAVTQAIGDIAENSNIMAPVDSPADIGGGGSIDLTGWPSFRGAKDTQQFLGPVWDGVTVPPHVELRKTQIASVSYNSAGEFSVMEFGPTTTHIYQPNYPNVQELVPGYVRGGMRWLPQPVDGKIHAYPIVLSNKFILGNERYDQAYNSPAGGPVSRGHRTIHWYSWLPGGEPMKDVNGMPVVISQAEGPQDSFYQLYSVTDRDKGEERFIDTNPQLNRGKIVIPIVNQTMFLNTVTVPMALGDALITVGIGRTNIKGRAPTAQELTVIDVEAFEGVRNITKQLPSGFIIRRSNVSGDDELDQFRIKSFDDYISTNKVTLEPPPLTTGGGIENPKSFKNQRQLRATAAEGTFTNIRFDVQLGAYELIEEPTNSSTNSFTNNRFSMVRVTEEELIEFFYNTDQLNQWDRTATDFFLRNDTVHDPRIAGTGKFAPARENGKDIEYKFRSLDGVDYMDGQAIKQGDSFTFNGVKYIRLLIYHNQDQGYPNSHSTIAIDESFGPIKIYTVSNYYFGYVDASDVENIEYLPWKAAKDFDPWGAPAKIKDDSIFISQASNISVANDYHHDYLKPERLQYVKFAGQPAYRLFFERNSNNNNGTFSGAFNSNTGLVIAQEKTAEEQAQDEANENAAGTLGQQPFIATDSVLTYDTAERATADFEAGIYTNERLIRVNNFRRSEEVGLGELFIVEGVNWMPVNEWEQAWREKTGTGVDVESHYEVINNVIGLRPEPLDVASAKPSMPAFEKPPTSKTITLGDRTVDLGPMHPFTDLISGADAYERATKAHFEDITPFVDVVENSQTVATINTAGLGGFDEEKVNAKKLAEAVTEDVKKIVNTAEDEKDKAKFDFATVTENLTSVTATSTALSVKSAAEAGTSLMSNARTSVIPVSSTAFPENEQLIARQEPPILPDPYDITSGGRIPS